MEDWKSAIVDFDVALALQPDAPSTLFLRGNSYARLGDFESAVRDLEACTGLQPNAADAYWELGVIHAFRRHLALAIASYETALAIAPAEYPGLAEELVTLKSELESQ
jgi:tetratricopeptide (TPR) repeat protein